TPPHGPPPRCRAGGRTPPPDPPLRRGAPLDPAILPRADPGRNAHSGGPSGAYSGSRPSCCIFRAIIPPSTYARVRRKGRVNVRLRGPRRSVLRQRSRLVDGGEKSGAASASPSCREMRIEAVARVSARVKPL